MKFEILFLLIFIKASVQQFLPDLKKINDDCAECRSSMIYFESRIAFRLSNFSQQIQKCSNDLKASNGPKTISDELDNFFLLTSQILTVNNFKPYESVDTCKDINFQIILMDLEKRKMNWVTQQVTSNITSISRQNSALITQYSLNLNRGLPYLSTNERSVYQIYTQAPSIIAELSSYLPVLQTCMNKLTLMATLMNAFRTKYCQCLAQISWTSTANDSTLKSNVEEFENRLRSIQSKISSSASSALSLVKKASIETENVYLPPLQIVLERQNKTSDFPSNSWPNVQNCNDLLSRGKFLMSKQLQYLQLLPPSNLDCALINFYFNLINSTRSNSATLNSAMSAVKVVESNCKNFVSLLITAFVRISVMAADVNSIGDTFCSCGSSGIATTVVPSSTSTLRSSTTTLAPITSTTTLMPTIQSTLTSSSTSITQPTTLAASTSTSTQSLSTSTSVLTSTTSSSTTLPLTSTLAPTTQSTSTSALTSTTSTSAATTSTTLEPCGILLPLSSNDPANPLTPGLLSGKLEDGANIYPGVGAFTQVSGTYRPATIVPVSASSSFLRGAYDAWSGFDYDATAGTYFKADPRMRWVVTTIENIMSVPNPVLVLDTHPCHFYVTRHNYTIRRDPTIFQWIGMYWLNGSVANFYDGKQSQERVGAVDVLVCDP